MNVHQGYMRGLVLHGDGRMSSATPRNPLNQPTRRLVEQLGSVPQADAREPAVYACVCCLISSYNRGSSVADLAVAKDRSPLILGWLRELGSCLCGHDAVSTAGMTEQTGETTV